MQLIIAAIVVGATLILGGGIFWVVWSAIPDGAFSPPIPNETRKSASLPAPPSGAPGAKLDLVIATCFNKVSPDVLGSRARYLSWADAEAGPTKRGRNIYGLYDVSDPADCHAAAAKAAKMSPERPALETAARDYASAAAAVHEIVAEAVIYYERANYKDDDFARGMALHEPLMEAFARFEAAHRALAKAIDNAFETIAAEREKNLRARDDQTALLILETQLAARELAALSNFSWRQFDQLDLETYHAKAKGYQRMVDRLASIDGIEDRLDDLAFAGSQYVAKSQKLAEAARELFRKAGDGGRFSHGDRMMLRGSHSSHWMIDGSPGKVLHTYNELIDNSPSPRLPWLAPVELSLAR